MVDPAYEAHVEMNPSPRRWSWEKQEMALTPDEELAQGIAQAFAKRGDLPVEDADAFATALATKTMTEAEWKSWLSSVFQTADTAP